MADSLLALGVTPDCIWGDDDETIVYAQVIGDGRMCIFRFSLGDSKPRKSLASRIVRYYHGIAEEGGNDVPLGFDDRDAMRATIWSSFASVWPSIVKRGAETAETAETGTVIDLDNDKDANVTWKAYQEPLFEQYLSFFKDVKPEEELKGAYPRNPVPIVDISQLVFLASLASLDGRGCRGCSKKVSLKGQPDTHFVFKGVDFQTYLLVHDDDDNDEFMRSLVETWRRSSKPVASLTECTMTPHPNIQSPPVALVAIRDVLVGHLSKFCVRGGLAAAIEGSKL